MHNDNFKKILGFALLGMHQELKGMQERILLFKEFGNDAVLFPNMHNAIRQRGEELENLQGMQIRHSELLELAKRTEQALQKMQDADFKESVSSFVKSF